MQKFPILSQASDTVSDVDGKPVLVVYPISKDLHTSMEVESLKVQTIMKYANIDFVLKEHHESNFSPSQQLPCLIIGEIVLAGKELIRYISTKTDLDGSCNKSERASAFAHAAMAQAKLGTALEACLWYETTQFNEITAKSRGVYYPWPLNYLIPRQERARVIDEILSRKPVFQMQDIFLAAAGALDALSLLLGEQLYFFGSR